MTTQRARPYLGTLVEIGARGAGAEAAVESAFAAVARVHQLMSVHEADSELSRVNRTAAHTPVAVSADLWVVLKAAQALARASDGLFDISVGARLAALGLLPKHAGLPQASHGNWRDLQLLPGRRVAFTRPLYLDLGGIAKGYAVDLALQGLRNAGMSEAWVNAGGDLARFGTAPTALRVRHPADPTRLLPLLSWRAGAAATSAGYYAPHRDGGPLSPLIDPRTGRPHALDRSITVIAGTALLADALTKIVALDPARASAPLAAHDARALILESRPDGSVAVFDSAAHAPMREEACHV